MNTQTMIREVCEALEIEGFVREGEWCVLKTPVSSIHEPLRPLIDYNDCHLLIDWMEEAGWKFQAKYDVANYWVLFSRKGEGHRYVERDFRIAALHAAHRALTSRGGWSGRTTKWRFSSSLRQCWTRASRLFRCTQ